MTAESATVEPPRHPLHAMTTYELRDYRSQLEGAITFCGRQDPVPPARDHDGSGLTADQLERARRDLEISLALAFPGSPVRVPILAEMTAIDTELAGRKASR